MNGIQRLTPKLGVLYALYLADGKVLGITRLNKLIARLQRDGFPIRNKFVNAEMGPYDRMIDGYATQLDSEGLIYKAVSPSIYYENDRQDFFLTSEGKVFVENEIMPSLMSNPFYEFFMDSYMKIKGNYITWP